MFRATIVISFNNAVEIHKRDRKRTYDMFVIATFSDDAHKHSTRVHEHYVVAQKLYRRRFEV